MNLLESFDIARNSADPKELLRFEQDLKDYLRANEAAMQPWYKKQGQLLFSIGMAVGCLRAMGKDRVADNLENALMG